jgi:hypothetical protein
MVEIGNMAWFAVMSSKTETTSHRVSSKPGIRKLTLCHLTAKAAKFVAFLARQTIHAVTGITIGLLDPTWMVAGTPILIVNRP